MEESECTEKGEKMIKNITMKNCASYDSIGVNLENCDKINFIYGHNGSGKSTISNYLSDRSVVKYNDCCVEFENGIETDVLVYNKAFREKNLQSTDMPGVFTLGEASAEQLAKLEKLKKDLKEREKEYQDSLTMLMAKEEEGKILSAEYKKNTWEQIFQKNDSNFKEAFAGYRSKKAAFVKKISDEYKIYKNSSLDRKSIEQKAETIFGDKPESLGELSLLAFSIANDIECDKIWKEVVVGNGDVDIAKLITSLNMLDWVKAGQQYIGEGDVCPFCQKHTINFDLKQQFERYFSGEFEQKTNRIKALKDNYLSYLQNISQIFQNTLSYIKKSPIPCDVAELEIKINNYIATLKVNLSIFETKIKEPSRVFECSYTGELAHEINKCIESYNEKVEEHNIVVENYKDERSKLIQEVWTLLIQENKTILDQYNHKFISLSKAIEGIKEKIKRSEEIIVSLKSQIIEENKNVTSVQPTVDAINRSLQAYGFNGFSIVPSPKDDKRYQIKRPNGSIASETLSEGEETFISFLYYVYMTKGGLSAEDAAKHKILIVDDPICSLDSSILYVVSSMVRDLIDDVKKGCNNLDQIFVLTHNVYFHKEVSFIDGRQKEEKNTRFWMLRKKDEITSCIAYEKKNPISTTYAMLWKEVKENDSISSVSLQNAMRRILENFFGTLGNANSSTILKYFETPEEKAICRSLFSWSNDGSHTIPDDLEFSENTDAPDKYRKIFKDIFYKTQNQYHYDRMME